MEAGASARCVGDSCPAPPPQEEMGCLQRDTTQKSNVNRSSRDPNLYEIKIGGEDDCLRSFLLQQVLVDERVICGPNWDTLEC